MPICRVCKKNLQEEEFYKSRDGRRQTRCKGCHAIGNRVAYCKTRIRIYEAKMMEALKGNWKRKPRAKA